MAYVSLDNSYSEISVNLFSNAEIHPWIQSAKVIYVCLILLDLYKVCQIVNLISW